MNNEEGYDDYNVFIRDCVRQLKETRFCYCYNLQQVEDITKKYKKRYKDSVHIEKNECGYTLCVLRRKEDINELLAKKNKKY